jgi:hypothetical protein
LVQTLTSLRREYTARQEDQPSGLIRRDPLHLLDPLPVMFGILTSLTIASNRAPRAMCSLLPAQRHRDVVVAVAQPLDRVRDLRLVVDQHHPSAPPRADPGRDLAPGPRNTSVV